MKRMRNVFATIIAIVSVIGAAYLGLWVMFIGGIVQGIDAVKMSPVDSFGIAVGIVRVVFAGLVGYIALAIGLIVAGLVGTKKYNFKRKRVRK